LSEFAAHSYRPDPHVSAAGKRAVTYIVRGELAYLFFVIVSVALHPGFVLTSNEGGMSNYGLHIKTAVPYTLALALLALYSQRAAMAYANGDRRVRRLGLVLTSYSAVLLLILLSSYIYSLDVGLKDVHFALGTVLVVLVGAASLWMFRAWPLSATSSLLLLVQLAGDSLALLTAVGDLHLLFLAEMLANLGFAGLLIRTSRQIARQSRQDPLPYDAGP
jgi:hypothetical protein